MLKLWPAVDASVEVATLDADSAGSVPEMLVGPSVAELRVGVEDINTSDWSVLSSVTLRDGVESEVPSDAEVC